MFVCQRPGRELSFGDNNMMGDLPKENKEEEQQETAVVKGIRKPSRLALCEDASKQHKTFSKVVKDHLAN